MAAGAQLDKMTPPGERPQSAAAGAGSLGRLSVIWEQGRQRWTALAPRQRSWAILGGGLLLATVVSLIWLGTRTDWRTLYAGMDPEDSRAMAQVLTQAQISFDVSANGALIRVPAGQLDKARLATAAKGGPRSGRMGFELFDKPNWVGSEFDEQVNYQRALEGELEHTVATLTDVQSARVHLVMTHDSLFRDQERPAKAAVVLTLRHSALAEGEADSIRNLVASAVDGLSPGQVSLVDAGGHHLLGELSPEAGRLAAEQALESKLIETLEPVTGAGNVRASVTVDYDPTATDETEETYDPDQTVTLAMQRTEQSSGPLPVASGVPGTASNAPNSTALPVYPQQTTQPQTAKSENGTYGVSRKVRHITQAPGHMRRLTAAVVVNDRIAAPAKKGKTPTWLPRTPEELRNLTALAQSAVGFDSTRGDVVTVEDLAFDENRTTLPVSISGQALSVVEHSPVLMKYSALLVGLLLLIVLAIRPALRGANPKAKSLGKNQAGSGAQLGAGQGAHGEELAAGFAQAALPPHEPTEAEIERNRVQQVFEQVTDQLKQDPAQSSRLLQSWIHSD